MVYVGEKWSDLLPAEKDWQLAVWIVEILGPFDAACIDFQPSHSVTISEVMLCCHVDVLRLCHNWSGASSDWKQEHLKLT